MAGYYVGCPRCGNQLYDDGELADALVMCPHCRQQFHMPPASPPKLGSSLSAALKEITQAIKVETAHARAVKPADDLHIFEVAWGWYVLVFVPIASIGYAIVATAWSDHDKAERGKRWQQEQVLSDQEELEVAAEEARLARAVQIIIEKQQAMRTESDRRRSAAFRQQPSVDSIVETEEKDAAEKPTMQAYEDEIERLREQSRLRVNEINRRYRQKYDQIESQ